MADKRFYVYAVAIDCHVVYIGKGTGKRSQTHLRASHNPILREAVDLARRAGKPVRTRILKRGMSEHEAFQMEGLLIERYADRLTNVAKGVRSHWEVLLATLHHEWRSLKSEAQIIREGTWRGLTVDYRLQINREIRGFLAEMIIEARDALGLISPPVNSKA